MAMEVREWRVYGVEEVTAELERRWPGRWKVERRYRSPERKSWPYLGIICQECGLTWPMTRLDTYSVYQLGRHMQEC